MALPKLPARIECACGAVHTCDIKSVVCGKNAVAAVPELLAEQRALVLVTDGNTAPLAGDALAAALTEAGHTVHRAHFDTTAVVVPNEEAVAHIQAQLTEEVTALVGVGSGVINDLCKYVSCEAGLPYLIVATAPSMDGYASKGAAMILGGMKVTTSAPPPAWIVGDTALLATAPADMLRSGIGDLLGKYSCLNDWKLSALINGEPFCQEIYDMTAACADAAARDTAAILARDEEAVGRLFEGLVVVGIAMALAGNSRPASGSEHHLSHFYEIVGLQRGVDYLAHGIDVGYGTLVTCRLRQMVRTALPESTPFDPQLWRLKVGVVYGPTAPAVAELQAKTGFYDEAKRLERCAFIKENWQQICSLLAEAPSGEEIAAMLSAAGFTEREYYRTYGSRMIGESIVWAKDLKDRYTLFNMLEDLGVLESLAGAYVKEYL
ncbi:MAG: sn-glycerol-1-phosphate dehydrogenase [Oscillospiraceae bacterium]|nr:sn-glycerol-1-phosphate dehydrogenase [Oscillospiraceae bacterium]